MPVPVRIRPAEGFALWVETYDSEQNPLLELERRTLESLLGPLSGQIVVDAACGSGRWMRIASQAGAKSVGFDFSLPMLRRANRGRVARATLSQPPFLAKADVLICSVSLSYCDVPQEALEALGRMIAPGGMLAVSDLHPAAAEAGWARTFRRGSNTYEIPATYEWEAPRHWELEHRVAAEFGDADSEAFSAAERPDLFAHICGVPALRVEVWRVPGAGSG